MARSQKPKRKYNPDRLMTRIATKMEHAVQKLPMREDAQRDIGIATHIALDLLMRSGDKDSLYVLATSLDVAHELCVRGCCTEYLSDIERGMAALVCTKKQANLTGSWKLTGEDAELVRIAVLCHDEQVETVSRALMVDTLKTVMDRVANGVNETEFETLLLEAA